MVLNGKSLQEDLVNARGPQGSILDPTLFLLYMTFLTMLSVILLSMLIILLSVLNVMRRLICGNNLNWLLNFTVIYETLNQLVPFDLSNNIGSIDVKMVCS